MLKQLKIQAYAIGKFEPVDILLADLPLQEGRVTGEPNIYVLVTTEHDHAHPIVIETGGPHEEGYCYHQHRIWTEKDDSGTRWVYMSEESEMRDCDGPLFTARLYRKRPQTRDWERLHGRQRDAYAEREGY